MPWKQKWLVQKMGPALGRIFEGAARTAKSRQFSLMADGKRRNWRKISGSKISRQTGKTNYDSGAGANL